MAADENPDLEPRGLVGVLHVIASRLRHPLFLVGLGAAILLTLIALGGPDGGQLYAGLIAGLILVLAIIWALTTRRTTDSEGHRLRLGSHLKAEGDILQESGRGGHRLRIGRRAHVQDIVQRSGPPAPPPDDQ